MQREQILAKKQEVEVMRAKNCGRNKPLVRDGLRPESATNRKLKKSTIRNQMNKSEKSKWTSTGDLDSSKPMDITEEEELERITGMLQRDNLVRGVGIVEEVYKLLHCTPGTGGPRKDCCHHSHQSKDASQSKHKTNDPISDDRRHPTLPNSSNTGGVATSNYLGSNSISRLYPHSFSQSSVPGLGRSDHRRTFASIARAGSNGHLSPGNNQINGNMNKHRLGSRKMLPNRTTFHVSEHDARFSDADATSHGSEANFNQHLRRTLSASGLSRNSSLASNQGKGHHRSGSNLFTTNTSTTIQPFMQHCMYSVQQSAGSSMKVTAHHSPLELSVISAPAPISYKTISKSTHGTHSGADGISTRSNRLSQRIRSTSSDSSCKQLQLRENHGVVLS